nr:immunoglobulin light chain junction region [Macaca mulatta]
DYYCMIWHNNGVLF